MSKGLEALKDIRDICSGMTTVFDKDLNIIEKDLRALEIIKNKGVDILALQHYENASQYNFSLRGKFSQLTEEEYNLLKGILL